MKIADDVTRYDRSYSCSGTGGKCFERIVPVVGGEYVRALDYDALAAEVTKLRADAERRQGFVCKEELQGCEKPMGGCVIACTPREVRHDYDT